MDRRHLLSTSDDLQQENDVLRLNVESKATGIIPTAFLCDSFQISI